MLILTEHDRTGSDVRVRTYTTQDRAACLAVFDSNVPESFNLAERLEYEAFLDSLPGPYLVLERDGRVVSCGGFARAEGTSCADLCWGMVERQAQGRGLGRMLTEARLQRIRQDPSITEVALRTSHVTEAFYARLGFVTERVTPDGIAPGLHKCDMRLTLVRA
jgi:N-acetylglutamate synthase-like GNAT family acetyltransferase